MQVHTFASGPHTSPPPPVTHPPPPPRTPLVSGLLVVTVAAMIGFGCDTGTLAPVTEPDLPKGPSLDAFPRAALFTEGEIDGLLSQKSGDTLVVVPLVFDESDRLHSPLSFNLRLDSLRSSVEGGAGSPDPDQTFFTDYDTFLSVINGHKNARGESYAALYPSTDRFAAPGGVSVGNKQRDGYTGLYDPFSCLDNPDDCPADPGGTPPTYGHPGGPGGAVATLSPVLGRQRRPGGVAELAAVVGRRRHLRRERLRAVLGVERVRV